MSFSYKHIVFFIIALLAVQAQAQLYVQEGLKVSEGTALVVVGDIVLASDSSLVNEGIVNSNVQIKSIETLVSNKDLEPVFDQSSVQLSQEVALPVTYINVASKSYQTKTSNPVLEYIKTTISEVDYASIVLQDSFNLKLNLSQSTDYILPIIYSYTFYKRFTEDAQLYEFEQPYASLRPPIV